MEIPMKAIGMIHTPFQDRAATPIQSARSDAAGTVKVFEEYIDGLDGIEDFSHLILLYAFHQISEPVSLKVKPFLDDQMHGIFATRFPVRPNPLGLSVVRLVERKGSSLMVLGVDMFDSTPLLDIKPYVPDFDIHSVSKIGWYSNRAHP